MLEICAPRKTTKNNRQQVVNVTAFVSKRNDLFTPVTLQKSLKFTISQKWIPGTSWDPKGIQKISKRHPKGVQKTSKRRPHSCKLDPTGIEHLKSQCKELQRTLHPIRASQLQQNHQTFSMSKF